MCYDAEIAQQSDGGEAVGAALDQELPVRGAVEEDAPQLLLSRGNSRRQAEELLGASFLGGVWAEGTAALLSLLEASARETAPSSRPRCCCSSCIDLSALKKRGGSSSFFYREEPEGNARGFPVRVSLGGERPAAFVSGPSRRRGQTPARAPAWAEGGDGGGWG